MGNPTKTLARQDVHSVTHNALAEAHAQFDRAAERLQLDAATRALLRTPMREYRFAIPMPGRSIVPSLALVEREKHSFESKD